MQLTDIKIRKIFDDGPMRAVVSVTFDGQFAVHDIKVIYANDKYFIVMPSRKNADGTYRDIAHPINAEFRSVMENAVLAEFQIALKEHEEAKLSAAADTLFEAPEQTAAPAEEATENA